MAEPAQQQDQTGPSSAYTAPKEPPQREEKARVYGLVTHLIDDVAILVRKEIALAGSELSKSVNDTKKGASGMLSGAVVLNSGFIFLLAAATLGLAQIMPGWAAALIVGAVVTVIGMIMVQSGKKKFEPSSFKPERTMDDLRKDQESVRRATS